MATAFWKTGRALAGRLCRQHEKTYYPASTSWIRQSRSVQSIASQTGPESSIQLTSRKIRHQQEGSAQVFNQDLQTPKNYYNTTLSRFDMSNKPIIVTGGAQGLGLAMAIGCAEGGANVYCLDRADKPGHDWTRASENLTTAEGVGGLYYRSVDITDTEARDSTIEEIASEHSRLDGVIAAAGVQQINPAVEYSVHDARKMLDVNFTGCLMTATSAARQMAKFKTPGPSIVLVASMSGMIANKGLQSPVYNASKAAVIQLARSLSMEWAEAKEGGLGGIRVNALSPGHVLTPMVKKNFEQVEDLRATWEAENMLHRIAQPEEFAAAGPFLLSAASSFMTGNNLVIDGGHTAW